MDIKRQYFDLIEKRVDVVYESQSEKLEKVAAMFGQCMTNGGVVQLFGVNHGEEFVNEMFYRAGGIAPLHGIKPKELMLKGIVKPEDMLSGNVYNDTKLPDRFAEAYQLDDRDMYVVVSFYGTEPLAIEIAKRAKEKGQKVVAVVNKKSYDSAKGTLLDYADEYLDMCADDPDIALHVGDYAIGQISSTLANIIAQMLTAEVYTYYVNKGLEAPVLLSANIKGADVHNNSLTDPYERRVR